MAVSEKSDEPRDLPCNDHERRKMLKSAKECLDVVTNLPIGAVVFWTKAIAEAPPGWAIMDGRANMMGSAINMVDHYFKSTDGNAPHTVGHAHGAEPLDGGEHTHTGSTSPVSPFGVTDSSFSHEAMTSESDTHTHTLDIELREGIQSLFVANHTHQVQFVSVELIGIQAAGDASHDHEDAFLAETTINPHSPTDITACFADHPAHDHVSAIINKTEKDPAGVATIKTPTGEASELTHAATQELTHNGHVHELIIQPASFSHTHDQIGHDHLGELEFSGSHKHDVQDHKHFLDHMDPLAAHSHQVSDNGHSHFVLTNPHTHTVSLDSGSHMHDSGDPKRALLLYLERIS